MKQHLYVIFDVKAEAPVGVVQWFSTDAQAVRMFASVVAAPGSLISEHPEDFQLLRIGELDFGSLKIEPNLSSRHVPISEGRDIARALRARGQDDPMSEQERVRRSQLDLISTAVERARPEAEQSERAERREA